MLCSSPRRPQNGAGRGDGAPIFKAFHGSQPDSPILSGGFLSLAGRVGSGQEVFQISPDGTGRVGSGGS